MYEFSLGIFYDQLRFFGNQNPYDQLDGSPHLFYAKNICHLKALRHSFAVKNIVNSILSECTTHITMFYIIAVAAIHLTNALSSQK